MLQAYLDDSGTKGTGSVLLLGGLMAKAEVLAPITDQWDRELRATDPGRIAYFKSDEASMLAGEFNHWKKKNRDEKVRRMAKHLNRTDLTAVFSGVNLGGHTQMERVLSGFKILDAKHHAFNHPLFLAFFATLMAAGQEALREKATERIEIFIDNNDIFRDEFRRQYEVWLGVAKEPLRSIMPDQLYFRDDKEFVLLQAADLLMGDARLRGRLDREWPRPLGLDKLRVSPHSKPLTEDRLMEITDGQFKSQGHPNVRIRRKKE